MILIKKFIGENGELPVSFDPFLQEKECMVNATEMAKIFGKLTTDYLRTQKTREYLKVLEIEFGNSKFATQNNQNLEVQDGNSHLETEKTEVEADKILEGNSLKFSENILKVVHGGRNNGTWMHRFLAIDFAMWLDPYFNLWVAQTIDQILFGYARKRDLSFKRTLEVKDRMKELEDKLEPTGDDFKEYLTLKTELKHEQNTRQKITTERISEIQVLIFTEKEMGRKVDE